MTYTVFCFAHALSPHLVYPGHAHDRFPYEGDAAVRLISHELLELTAGGDLRPCAELTQVPLEEGPPRDDRRAVQTVERQRLPPIRLLDACRTQDKRSALSQDIATLVRTQDDKQRDGKYRPGIHTADSPIKKS